jgi:hypothetical protein
MTNPETPETGEPVVVRQATEDWFRVRLTHPNHHKRTVFRSMSEKRARAWLVARCPRGSEFYLQTPTGETFHHEAERVGERGIDAEQWAPFDPETWVPVEATAPPGQDAWSDREG